MSSENTALSNRFFYYNPATSSETLGVARTWPMHKLHAMYVYGAAALRLVFDDSGFGDHMVVNFVINNNKGKEAIKDIVDAINSNQQTVVLGDNHTGESVMNDFESVGTTGGGSAGTFALNGSLTVAGSSTHEDLLVGSETVASGALRTARGVSFLATTGTASFSLAAPDSSSGRIKYIVMTTAGGTGTLTIAEAGFGGVGHVFAFANVGESLTLISMGSKWHVLSRGSGAVQAHNAVSGLPAQTNP